jgi:hypothetical protein
MASVVEYNRVCEFALADSMCVRSRILAGWTKLPARNVEMYNPAIGK